ncbi:uncharacterized protein LOC110832902 isoform X3 [Zootermopsis nevadensis]|nr:uncharacterized protein LOC110832902 isoform X3 [Zootermopsis nevadensis]XP_021926049.1 uncharacterized protein LOC110832902 isoform X3 [Zootermopsis nevadensis]
MAGDGEQNSDQCVLKTIVGHLTAFSHVFRSDPKVAFMEFMYANKQVCHVALRQDLATYKNVAMGKLYQVTHLHPRRMLYRDGEAVRLLEATRETSFILSADNEEMVLEPSLNTCNYEGKVVEPCSSLGIYRLHDNNRLCLGFLLTFADVPLPSVGQTVSVYNCHLWRNKSNDRYDVVLCGRSSIVLHGESDKTLNSETSNFININLNCSYLNLLWVEKQLGHFEEKFSDPFLTENGIVCKSARELQEGMLIKTVDVYYPVKKEDIKERYITREFLFSPHQCIFSKPLSFTGAYLTFHDLWRQATSRYNLVSSKVWNYHLFHYTDGLVGLLSTNLISGCWTLSDATKGFLCVVTGDMENLMMLHGAVVLLIKCTIVTEVFKDTNFVYIYFTATDARIIHTFDSRAGNDCRLMKKKKRKDSVMTCHSDGYVNDSEKASTSDIIHAREGTKNKQRSGQFDVENIVGYNLVTKETVVPSKYTWLIVVHHKTAAVKPSQCALPMCCLLVSLIGRIHEVSSLSFF